MIDIVAATPSVELAERLSAASGSPVPVLPAGPLPADLRHLLVQLGALEPPRVVLLDCTLGTDEALALATRLSEEPTGPRVVLVSDRGAELALTALRAGVVDIVHPDAEVAELARVLGQAVAAAALREPPQMTPSTPPVPRGRVVSVVSSKGGAGKTTVSTNIAVALAQHAPQSTVLVDLDVQFGDVASALNLEPEYTLLDAVSAAAGRDSMVLKTFLTLHQTGLYVLAAPDSPAGADQIRAEDVDRVLSMLAAEFAFVVVDTAPGLSEHTLAALDRTTDPVLLASMDVPGLRGLRKEVETLTELGMLSGSRRLVVNFADPRSGLTIADVEATIGTRVDVALPRSKSVPASVNLGVPLLQSGGNDKVTKQLRVLVASLVGGADVPAKPLARKKGARPDVVAPRRAARRWGLPVRAAS